MTKTRFKEVFVFVVGMTPQIVTETIYALSRLNPPVIADEISIITTSTGKDVIQKSILKNGVLDELARDCDIPAIPLNDNSFVIVSGNNHNMLADIRDEEDNEKMGDLITSFVREKAQEPSVRLHCSLAGGRKTMSFYLGAALQLFGRPWDKLYHVLVTPEFESNPDFYYKPKTARMIECRMSDGSTKKLSTEMAEIRLAELPFIRLRDKLSFTGKSFRELVAESQKEIDTAKIQQEVHVDLKEGTLFIGKTLIELTPVQLVVYAAFLKQKAEHCKYKERHYCLDCTDCYIALNDLRSPSALEQLAEDYKIIYGSNPSRAEDFLHKWKKTLEADLLRQNISKIKSALKDQLDDESMLPYYAISTARRYGNSKYGVRVEKGKIRVG